MPTTVNVTRRLLASPRRAFDAFVDPAVVEAWFGPGQGRIVGIELAPRIGGMFSVVQRRGGKDVEVRGTYLELERPRRLVLTWAVPAESLDESIVTIQIEPAGAGSAITLTHELAPSWLRIASDVEASWIQMLDAIADALAPLPRAGAVAESPR
jgi:uncharacterized protein YndB with AHSA1/START domain